MKNSSNKLGLKHSFDLLLLITFLLTLPGCFSGNYLYLKDKGDLAIVSFSIDRRIFHENDTTSNDGPALLESTENKDTWWDNHIAAINRMYDQFRQRIPEALLGTKIVDHQIVASNPTYLTMTKHEPKIIMGKDVSLGWSRISPAGLNYVSGYNSEKLDSLSDLFKVNLALVIECKARWHVIDSLHEIKNSFGLVVETRRLGHILLDVSVMLHEKGKGMTWSRNYNRLSPNTLVDLEWDDKEEPPQMKKADFPDQLEKALLEIYPQIRADAQRGVEEIAKQQAEAK